MGLFKALFGRSKRIDPETLALLIQEHMGAVYDEIEERVVAKVAPEEQAAERQKWSEGDVAPSMYRFDLFTLSLSAGMCREFDMPADLVPEIGCRVAAARTGEADDVVAKRIFELVQSIPEIRARLAEQSQRQPVRIDPETAIVFSAGDFARAFAAEWSASPNLISPHPQEIDLLHSCIMRAGLDSIESFDEFAE